MQQLLEWSLRQKALSCACLEAISLTLPTSHGFANFEQAVHSNMLYALQSMWTCPCHQWCVSTPGHECLHCTTALADPYIIKFYYFCTR